MKKEDGFTLIEILVSSAIGSVIIVVVATIMILTGRSYNTNTLIYQNFSALQTSDQIITEILRENDAQSVSVTDGGQVLNIGSTSFSFSGNDLIRNLSSGTQVIANNISGSFSESPSDSPGQLNRVAVTISLQTQDPSKSLISTVTVYPTNASP